MKDCGLIGDGKSDNYPALQAVLQRVLRVGEPTILEFEREAVYYFNLPPDCTAIFRLDGIRHLVIHGDNTLLLLDNGFTFFDIRNCEDITIVGFNFKLFKPIYTVSEIMDVNFDKPSITVRSKESLGITGFWRHPGAANFGVPNLLNYGRKHVFYHSIDTLDADDHTYELYISRLDNYMEKLKFLDAVDYSFITPIPNVGQVESNAFVVTYTRNLRMENCNVWSASYFIFHMRYNDGTFLFRNVNIRPQPGSCDLMVAWRDGFHIKENRAKFIWEDCTMGGIFDDIWNLSCSILTVREVFSPSEFEMGCMEFQGEYPAQLLPGDELGLYDVESGALVGETRIRQVVMQDKTHNRVIVEDPLPLNKPGTVQVCVYSLANPGAEIRHCKIDGTFRFRGEVAVSDSDFRLFYSWIENEPPYEGPIPRNITFRRCRLKGLNDECKIMTLGTMASFSKPVKPHFYLQNIRFEDCDMEPGQFYIRSPLDDVRFIRCKNEAAASPAVKST